MAKQPAKKPKRSKKKPKAQTVEVGIAEERDEALPITAEASAATGPAGVVGRGAQIVPTPTQQARGDPEMGSGRAAQTMPTPQSGPIERGRGVTRTFSTKKNPEQPDAEDTLGAEGAGMNLLFDTVNQIITINEPGKIEASRLYRAIKAWEASSEGIVHPSLVERSGNIELPDGTRSPRYIILLGGWHLAAVDPVWIVGGYLAGRDQDGKGYHPVLEEARDRVRILDQKPDQDGGVNIEVPVTKFTLTGHAPTVEVTPTARQQATPYRLTVETAEEIEEAARQHFTNAPTIAIAEAKQAKAIAIALSTAIDDLRPNNPEAGRAKDLLAKQVDSLDRIIVVLEAGGDTEAALQTYRELLDNLGREFLNALSDKGALRGIIAAAVLSAAAVAGCQLSMVEGSIIAGSIVGPNVVEAVGKLVKGWKRKEE